MSILLDAVIRNKQQQQSQLPDAVMTPRANYSPSRKAMSPTGRISLLVLAVAAGVGAAWGLNAWDQAQLTKAELTPTELIPAELTPSRAVVVASPLSSMSSAVNNEPLAESKTQLQTESNAESVRFAGKVALPRAQTLPELAAVSPFQPGAVVSNTPQIDYTLNTTTPAVGVSDASYADYMSTSAQVDAANRETIAVDTQTSSIGASQTMMLGANANGAGLASLEALRQQVSAAAEDVGLETNKSRDEDKLVATFQTALKKVEYTHAAKTPVTEAKLDPIPKTAVDDIPKYGQLPAGLQLQVPEFNIVAHVYSTDSSQRWLNVDGAELQEGDLIAGKLKIIAIRPRDIVLDIQGTQFKVPAI